MLAFFKTRSGMVALGFMAIGGYFLVTEHGAHTIAWLPWFILLACPFLHLFMHGGHGHGGHSHDGNLNDNNEQYQYERKNRPDVEVASGDSAKKSVDKDGKHG